MSLRKFYCTDVYVHKEALIILAVITSGSGCRKFLKHSSTLRDRAFFHSLAYISGESDRIFMKISSQMYPWAKKFPLNFGSNPDPKFVSGYGLRIQTIFSLADLCSLWQLYSMKYSVVAKQTSWMWIDEARTTSLVYCCIQRQLEGVSTRGGVNPLNLSVDPTQSLFMRAGVGFYWIKCRADTVRCTGAFTLKQKTLWRLQTSSTGPRLTSHYLRQGGYVMPSVYLFVCLSAR